MERIMSESLKTALGHIENEIIFIHRRYYCLKELFGTEKSYVQLLNQTAPYLFYLVQTGFYENIVLSISRLVDPAKQGSFENVSFEKFIGLLEGEALINENEAHNKLINELKLVLKNYVKLSTEIITEYRNKKIAHNDLNVILNQKQINDLTFQKIEIAMESLRDFVNIVNQFYNNSKKVYSYSFTPLTSGLFKSLHLAKLTKEYIGKLNESNVPIPEELVIDSKIYNFNYDVNEKSVFQKTELNEIDKENINIVKQKTPKSPIFKK